MNDSSLVFFFDLSVTDESVCRLMVYGQPKDQRLVFQLDLRGRSKEEPRRRLDTDVIDAWGGLAESVTDAWLLNVYRQIQSSTGDPTALARFDAARPLMQEYLLGYSTGTL